MIPDQRKQVQYYSDLKYKQNWSKEAEVFVQKFGPNTSINFDQIYL